MSADKRNGCFNRPPFAAHVMVQFGWTEPVDENWGSFSRQPILIEIPNPMTKECQYSRQVKFNDDPGCEGCVWKCPMPDVIT